MNKTKLRNILKAISPDSVDFSAFDNEIIKLKNKLKDQVVVKTLEDVNVALERNRKLINFEPLTSAFNNLKQTLETKDKELLQTLNSKQEELGNLIKQTQGETSDQIDRLSLEISLLSARKIEIPDFSKQIKDTEKKLKTLIESLKSEDEQTDKLANEKIQTQFTELEGKIKKLRQDTQRGGSMHQKISIGGTVVSTRYADINLIAGSGITLSTSDNNTTKQTDITIVSSGGSGLTNLPATGTVDGSNTAFTFTQKPTYIVSDGAWYLENSGWTWSVNTATMSVPPQTGIFGFA